MISREQLAEENEMSIEFVNWFFDNKKDGCGNAWFMMMAVMWEGCKCNEQKLTDLAVQLANAESKCRELAAENAGLKATLEEIEVINRGGQAYCVKDGMSVNPIYARGWNDYRAKALSVETPATESFLAEIRAQGVEMAACSLDDVNQFNYANMLDDLAQKIRQEAAQ